MANDIALFIHLLGVVALFAATGITQTGGARLRRSTTVDEVRTWSNLVERGGRMFGPALIVIIGAGIYMANDTWGFDRPFVVVGIATAVFMAAFGGLFVGRGYSRIAREVEDKNFRAADIPGVVQRPGLWASNVGLNGMSIGIIWVMVSKPDWGEAVGTVAGLAIVGAFVGSLSARRAASSRPNN